MKQLIIAASIAILASCTTNNGSSNSIAAKPEYAIGTIAQMDTTKSTYEELSAWVETLDGFIADTLLDAPQYSLLAKVLDDCNVPVADESETDSLANEFHHAKVLMDSIIVLDTHSDFPEKRYYHPERGYSIDESQSRCQTSLEKMRQGHMSAQYMAFWMDPLGQQTDPEVLAKSPAVLWNFIDMTEAHLKEHADKCAVARNRHEIDSIRKEGKIALLYGLENAVWAGTDIENVKRLADRGVTYITLSHWGDNQVCHSSDRSEDSSKGLTEYGKKFIAEMNRQGIVIDLSHTSYGTWQDVLKLSKAPVAFTHSGAAEVFAHQRNIDDETLKALAANGGVVHVYIVPNFMAKSDFDNVGIKEMVDHIDHIVAVAGIDHVGVGMDFDGGGGGKGYNGSNDAINLTVELIRRGYSDADIAKIWGGNWLRVLDAVQSIKE